ncbi:MAG: hypothetical protein JWP06_110 [Candidatus Saccharibacteria bacterium]|nr:hypothetical protein [Candidatus Saccharibacteria bacterium]
MSTERTWDITSEAARLALVDGWFGLANQARARGDLHEAQFCEDMAREYCSDDEYREHLNGVIAFYVECRPDELLQALNAR